jgi:hypothetical protein
MPAFAQGNEGAALSRDFPRPPENKTTYAKANPKGDSKEDILKRL